MPDDAHTPGSPPNGNRTNGSSHPVPPFLRALPDAETDVHAVPADAETDVQAPLDLVAVQADDELVNALGARTSPPSPAGPTGSFPAGEDARDDGANDDTAGDDTAGDDIRSRGTDERLVAMLATWRAEIDAVPIPELVDLDTAVAAVQAGIAAQASTARRRRAGRLRQLAPLAAAAAIIVATVTGVGMGSQNAVPGDTLWPIQKVVNPERAESVEAKVKVESRLETVRAALKNGDTATAAKELDAIRTEIPAVRGQEGQPDLRQEQEFLAAKLADTPPGQPADLSTPPKSNPAARSTGAPVPPLPPPVPPVDSSATESPKSASATEPKPAPDVRKVTPDKSDEAVAPRPPVRTEPVVPEPEKSAPDKTSAPEEPKPKPKPQPEPTSPGGDEGKPDPTVDPGPADPPPPSGNDSGASSSGGDKKDGGGSGGGSSDTTAAGSAGAAVDATATDTTT